MNSQRRVTAPPRKKVVVVTDSLRQDSPEKPHSIATVSGYGGTAPALSTKELRSISPFGSSAFAQAFYQSDLILPVLPGVG
jgi:hypothetical protein